MLGIKRFPCFDFPCDAWVTGERYCAFTINFHSVSISSAGNREVVVDSEMLVLAILAGIPLTKSSQWSLRIFVAESVNDRSSKRVIAN